VILDNLKKYDLIYLASPYTKYPEGLGKAFEHIALVAGDLIERGLSVYSPIVHSHPIAVYGDIHPKDYSIWKRCNAPLLKKCQAMLVAMMPSWEVSAGINDEISEYNRRGKPVFYLDPKTAEIFSATPELEAIP